MQPATLDLGDDIAGRVEQRVQFEHLRQPVKVVGQLQRSLDALGSDPGDADQLFGADVGGQFGVVLGAGTHRDPERQVQQVHLQHHLVGDAHQGRVRERGEVDVGQQRPGVVGLPLVLGVDGAEFPVRGVGLRHDVERRDAADLGVGLVDDDGPGAVRVAVGGVRGGRWIGRTWALGLVATAVASNVGSSMSWHMPLT